MSGFDISSLLRREAEDLLPEIEDSIRSGEMAAKPIIGIQVITMACPCGGACENNSGSTMIEASDTSVQCLECGAEYNVPASAFKAKGTRRRPEPEDEETRLENQRLYWEDRRAIERDYPVLY